MKTLKFVTLFALALPLAAQERPVPKAIMRQVTDRLFDKTCEAIWPVAMKVAIAEGWKVKAGGIPGQAIHSDSGTIRLAAGERDCQVYVSGAGSVAENKILDGIAVKIPKKR